MRIESVSIAGFRGIDAEIPVSAPLGIIAGANNAGKSSVIDALRCVLQPLSDGTGQRWITPNDFTTCTLPGEEQPEIVITVNLAEIGESERGRMISILSPARGAGTGRLTLRSRLGSDGRPRSRYLGGDFDQNDVESIAREGIRFVYLHPLRDAAGDLKPGQGNRLSNLVSAYAPEGHDDREAIVEIIAEAHKSLREVPSVAKSADAIQSRLTGITGEGPFAHLTDLGFSEARYEKIVNNLQALLGGSEVSRLLDNGLGYNNLLYISVILAALETDEGIPLSVLLVEEPEAHLHPQLQALLMQYLEGLSASTTQVIATTHSPQFASSAQVERVTVLSRTSDKVSPTAHALACAPLKTTEFAHLRRFLDVTKSMMLFAQGVVLVEGIAEQLLFPVLAQQLGSPLSEHGISVVSVDGLAFRPFVKLFNEEGLPFKCAVITDGDPEEEDVEDFEPSSTAQGLSDLASEQVKVSISQKTFEWDLAFANFERPGLLLEALSRIRPNVAKRLTDSVFDSPAAFADAFLKAIKKVKGPFAQELATSLESDHQDTFMIPAYLADAVEWVTDRG